MTAINRDFVVKNGLQVSSNLVVGTYVGPSAPQIAYGAAISGNVGIGTGNVIAGTRLQVSDGNVYINSANTGIVWQDGTFQTTAPTYTPSYGDQYTIQFAGVSNAFAGDSANLTWNSSNTTLSTNNIAVTSGQPATYQGSGALQVYGGGSVSGNLFVGGNFTVAGNLNIANVGGIQDLVVNSLISNTFIQAAGTISGGIVNSNGYVQAATYVLANVLVSNSDVQAAGNVIANGVIANVSVGIGTATSAYPLDVYGNIHIGNTATISGIVFPDGSFLSTAGGGGGSPSFGSSGTVQFAGSSNLFAGDTDNLYWDDTAKILDVSNIAVTGYATVGSLTSNSTIQAAGSAMVNSLISNVNVGIATSTVTGSNALSIFGTTESVGNIFLVNTAATSGIVFSDGTFQATAATSTPSFGVPGTLQFAGAGNTFAGNTSQLFWDDATQRLGVGTNVPTATLTVNGNTAIFGHVGIGTDTWRATDNLTVVGGNINVATSGTGIVFPDGSFQQTSAGSSAAGSDKSVQFNDAGQFAGSAFFIFDKVNYRLGIGTNNLTQGLMVYSSTPALFNTTNGADQQIIVGNGTVDGSVMGFASTANPAYGYVKYQGAATTNIVFTATGTGIGGITQPLNTLDVGGGMAVGYFYAGAVSAPGNGLIVQGRVGFATGTPYSDLDVNGWVGIRQGASAIGRITANDLVSNNIVTTNNLNAYGLAQVGSLIANTTVQVDGTATVNDLISNTNITSLTLNTANVATIGNVIVNVHATTQFLNVTADAWTNSLVNNLEITTGTLNTMGAAQVNSLVSNTTIQSIGTTTVNALVVNTAITASNLSVTDLYAGNVTSGGLGQFQSLISNTYLQASTVNATSGLTAEHVYSNTFIQAAGTATVNALNSNTTITAGNGFIATAGGINVQSNALSTFSGNVFVGGNLYVAGNLVTTQSNVLIVEDPIIFLAVNNPADSWDIGMVGEYTSTGVLHTGFVRDHSDGVWKLFDNEATQPNLTVNWNTVTYANFLAGNANLVGQTVSVDSQTGTLVIPGVGGIGVGGAINAGDQIATTAGLNIGATAIVNALISNTDVTAGGSAVAGAIYSNTTIQSAGTATVNALVSNTGISSYSLQVANIAVVDSLTSNTFVQAAGNVVANLLSINTAGSFGGNVVIAGNVWITDLTPTTTYDSGALFVAGGIGSAGNIHIQGSVTAGNVYANTGSFFGDTSGFNALYAGISTGFTLLPNNIAQFSGNSNSYVQVNLENINSGTNASSDFIATANNGDDTTYYIDMGINGSAYDPVANGMTSQYANDSYLVGIGSTATDQGGNLVVGTGTEGKALRFIAGGLMASNVVAEFSPTLITFLRPVNLNAIVVDSLTSNTYVQALGDGIFGNVYSNGFTQTAGISISNAVVSNTTVQAPGDALFGNVYSNGNIQSAGLAVVNSFVSNTSGIFGGNVGIGTTSIPAGANVLSIYGTAGVFGNITLANTAAGGSGIYFPDGTFQTTAVTPTPSFGLPGTIQFAGSSNTFSGNGDQLFWDSSNNWLGIGIGTPAYPLDLHGNLHLGNTATISGIVFADGTFQNTAATGSGGGGGGGVSNSQIETFSFTATAGQTVFSVYPYTPGPQGTNLTSVFVNGVYQRTSTYSWTGTNITLSTPTVAYARVEIRLVVSLYITNYGSQIAGSNIFNVQTSGVTVWNTGFSYTVGYLDVYLNGVKLVYGQDYTAGTGTSITFAAAPQVGSIVQCTGWNSNGSQQIQGNNVFNVQTSGVTVWNTGFAYTPGYLDVYVNGVKLALGYDFSANDGYTVTFAVAPVINSLVEFTGWIQGSTLGQLATQRKAFYVAAAGQTTFPSQGPYVPPYVDVYVNGIKLLLNTDYNADSGNSVVLTQGLSAGANVEVISSITFALADVVRRNGDIFTGNVGIGTNIASSPFVVVGNSNFYGNVTVYAPGYLNVQSNIAAGGWGGFGGNLVAGGNLTVAGWGRFGANLQVTSNATIGTNLAVGQGLTVTQSGVFGTNVTVGSNLIVSSNVAVGRGVVFPDGTYQTTSAAGFQQKILVLNDISSAFDGYNTTFNLSVGSSNINIDTPQQLLIVVGGAILAPFITTPDYLDLCEVTQFNKGYRLTNGRTIQFANAPRQQQDFSGRILSNVSAPGNTVSYPFKALNLAMADC